MEDSPRDYANLTREIQNHFNALSRGDYYRRISTIASKELGCQVSVEMLEMK